MINSELDEIRLALSAKALDELRTPVMHPQYQAAHQRIEAAGPACVRIEHM